MNLNVFDFDYDLTWAGFFMNAEQQVYGRFGGRDAGEPDAHLSVSGLKAAMRQALAAYRRDPKAAAKEAGQPARRVEAYPAAQRLKTGACIHCHQVYDFRREALQAAGKWSLEQVWVYPSPENVGLTLDEQEGSRVRSVVSASPAEGAGIRAGDVLRSLNGFPVASFADAQYALHRAPTQGEITARWERSGESATGRLSLRVGWKKSDIAWRASMWGLGPTPAVHGQDLTPQEKQALGLPPNRLAFRQGRFVTKQAREAGVQEKDVIIGLNGKALTDLTMLQFNAYVRLNHRVGDRVTLDLIRNGQHLKVPMVLGARTSF